MPEYLPIDVKDLVSAAAANEYQGLSVAEVKRRKAEYGLNQLSQADSFSLVKMVRSQFSNPLVLILLVAAALSLALNELKDAVVIVVIVVLNAVIGFFQEFQAQKSINSLKTMIQLQVRVKRAGQDQLLDSQELVPGDVVKLQPGDKVPADLVLVQAKDVFLDESFLTGESVPVAKSQIPVAGIISTSKAVQHQAFGGSLLVRGSLLGVVVATGDQTRIGVLSQQVAAVKETKLPIQKKIDHFARIIGLITVSGSGLVMVLGIALGLPLITIFKDMVAVLVASVPEGLPIVVTVALAIGVQRMARSKAVIRQLPAVETLGSTTVIGTDKTGTLTKNQMTVTRVYANDQLYEVTGRGYSLDGQLQLDQTSVQLDSSSDLACCLRIGLLCNEASLRTGKGNSKNQPEVIGDPTEIALLISAIKAGLSPDKEAAAFPQLDSLPFDSDRQYMATLHQADQGQVIFLKGAPESVLELAPTAQADEIKAQVEALSQNGLRVLAMAKKDVSQTETLDQSQLTGGFTFCGLQAMIDPPRTEVTNTIADCRKAGIRVIMITGDHAITARAIARQVGILSGQETRVMTGREVQHLSDSALDEVVSSIQVFARVTPQDKLRIVEALKRTDQVVAVTGDGVNDAPALKAAHIGVAMGQTGTDVARDAADMVILDDRFTTIVKAVEQGRVVFETIRKVSLFLIPTGIAAILTVLATMALGIPIPYTPIQLLWINLVASGLQDIALAFEPGDGQSLQRPPIRQDEAIMTKSMLRRTLVVAGLISGSVIGVYAAALSLGVSLSEARSLAMTLTVLFQFFHIWNARSETRSVFKLSFFSNPFLFWSSLTALVAQLAVLYLPALQPIFETYALNWQEWIVLMVVAASVVAVVELDKALSQSPQQQKQP